MSTLWGVNKFAIEGENARKVYEAVKESHDYKTYPEILKMELREGVLFIEEEWSNYPLFGDFVLPFLVGDEYYYLSLWGEDNSWKTNDKEGKYFTIPTTECGARLIESETPAPQPKREPESKPAKDITTMEKIQDYCDKIKASLEKLGMPEFIVFGSEFDGHYYGEDPILPEDVDIWELLDETVSDMYGELRYGDYYELIRKVRIENGNLLFEVGGYNPHATFIEEDNCRLHENFTKDDLVNEYGEKVVKSHLECLLASFEDEEILKLNKMIVRPKFARR